MWSVLRRMGSCLVLACGCSSEGCSGAGMEASGHDLEGAASDSAPRNASDTAAQACPTLEITVCDVPV
jgi:hypothetical protein